MILDEIHLLGADRGPILEVSTNKITCSGVLLVTKNLSPWNSDPYVLLLQDEDIILSAC